MNGRRRTHACIPLGRLHRRMQGFSASRSSRGTRLTVELVLKALGDGSTAEELIKEYPSLKAEHIRAALLYAADVITPYG